MILWLPTKKHIHSKTCRKYKNLPCRFNFGQFFTARTIITEPLPDDLDGHVKTDLIARRNEILNSVKQEINQTLDPNRPEYNPNKTTEEVLNSIGITEEQYYWALSVSTVNNFDVHMLKMISKFSFLTKVMNIMIKQFICSL